MYLIRHRSSRRPWRKREHLLSLVDFLPHFRLFIGLNNVDGGVAVTLILVTSFGSFNLLHSWFWLRCVNWSFYLQSRAINRRCQ
jgi:hypothetical protein